MASVVDDDDRMLLLTMAAERGSRSTMHMRSQKPDREAAAARREKYTDVGYTPYARLARSEACNCAYSWASSIWCWDIARIPEAFHARPDRERTAAALLPFREACG
jgi:hypothetical protein